VFFSERTVKNVLHDVTTPAVEEALASVAYAVRQGLT
jgi:hypothetical protein